MSIVYDYKAIKQGVDRINGDVDRALLDEPQVRVSDFVDVKINYGEVTLVDPKIMVEGDIDPRWFGICKEPLTPIEEADMRTYNSTSTIERQQAHAFFVGMDLAAGEDHSVEYSNHTPEPKTPEQILEDLKTVIAYLKSSKAFPG